MVVSHQLTLCFLLVLFSYVSSQNYYQTPLTCYTKYEHEETRNQASSDVLSYAYSQAEMTQYATPEGEQCATVGCACFSYRAACSHSSYDPNHYSPCTDTDRRNGNVKWHRGLTSLRKCQEMRQHSQKYLDLTCCATDRCNDQPGKVTKLVNSNTQVQRYDDAAYRNTAYAKSPSELNDQTLQKHNSLSSISFSTFIICVALIFSRLITI
ncbi:unnamed protein product [Adineta ricciae]|uniref:Uncharacterized protein n=1 Tax=Adineta ricciae TaxID=249248 RepID=A0A814M9J0_ADIRI|nr:unnamed protein product [Adineta ricciae]CAF1399320.1 unnamed protein product [Adineta ricciae]